MGVPRGDAAEPGKALAGGRWAASLPGGSIRPDSDERPGQARSGPWPTIGTCQELGSGAPPALGQFLWVEAASSGRPGSLEPGSGLRRGGQGCLVGACCQRLSKLQRVRVSA